MDITQYIKVGALKWIVQAIPESANTDTVTVEIRRLSDGYTWNFTSTEFTSAATTGTMTFVNDVLWKQSFTPPTEDTYIVTIENSTLDVKYFQTLIASGAVAQSGVTGSELTTLAHVREYIGLDDNDTGQDTLIENLITRTSDEIEKECGRTFNASDLTEYYDGSGYDTLLVNNFPINSVTSLYDDIDREYNADDAFDSDDIIIDPVIDGCIRLDGNIFTKGRRNIKIVYNAGYSTIPTDLEQACINLVVAKLIEGVAGINAMHEGEGVYKPGKLKKEAQEIINRYKRVA